jgi:hypothetical protein
MSPLIHSYELNHDFTEYAGKAETEDSDWSLPPRGLIRNCY